MRILYLFFIGVSLTLLNGCNDSSSSNDNAASNTAAQQTNDSTAGNPDAVRGPLETMTELSDFSAKVRVLSKREVLSADPEAQIPYTIVELEVLETIFGQFDNRYGNDTFNIKAVGGSFNDGTDRQLFSAHSPLNRLIVGQEAIVFVNQRSNAPSDITQDERGVFMIDQDGHLIASNDSTVAFDEEGRTRFIPKSYRKSGDFKSLLANNHVTTFIDRIKQFAKNASDLSKGQRVTIKSYDKGQPLFGSRSLFEASPAPYGEEEHKRRIAKSKAALEKKYATYSAKDRWEVTEYNKTKNPVLSSRYIEE